MSSTMFSRVLVLNRGLIQADCVRAVRELGGCAIAAHEPDDRDGAAARNADEAYALEAHPGSRAYLDFEQIVELARRVGADAVHPGYGFLSQNPRFLALLREAEIAVIAPAAQAATDLSDQPGIRALAAKIGLNLVPGSVPCSDAATLRREVESLGYPMVLKANHHYAGIGMMIVPDAEALEGAYHALVTQCALARIDPVEIYAESILPESRRVEFPVLRDSRGQVIVFPEIERFVQRRFQKLLVESPSLALTPNLRARLESEVRVLVDRLDLRGFASVEFLLDGRDALFLEANGHVQPLHSVTSILSGVDLVKEQIRIVAGQPLAMRPAEINRHGHSIGVLVCAEDPENGFAPSPGRLERQALPLGEGVFVQTDVFPGDTLSCFYDPMFAKIIARSHSRPEAIAKLRVALEEFHVSGIQTNLFYLRAILACPEYLEGNPLAAFLAREENRRRIMDDMKTDEDEAAAALVAVLSLHHDTRKDQVLEAARREPQPSMWNLAARLLSRKKLDF